jgi:hypothetical protein
LNMNRAPWETNPDYAKIVNATEPVSQTYRAGGHTTRQIQATRIEEWPPVQKGIEDVTCAKVYLSIGACRTI